MQPFDKVEVLFGNALHFFPPHVFIEALGLRNALSSFLDVLSGLRH